MTGPTHRTARAADAFLDRWQSRIGMLSSVLVHVLFLLILLHAAKTRFAPLQSGGMGGARVKMEFIGQPPQGEKGPPAPAAPAIDAQMTERPRPARKPSPVQATQAAKADARITPDADRPLRPTPDDSAGRSSNAPPLAGDPAGRRRDIPAGQAPGLLARETAPVNNGADRGESRSQSPGPAGPGREPSVNVDGHQIYYDVRSETRLLEWQAQGMTELYFPLPGRRDYMVCPLEIVVRRGSGGCRLVRPDDPELAKIGDARKAVNVVQVYRRGELIWSGPGFYR